MSAAYERERFDIIVRRDFATFIFMAFKTVVGGQEYLPNWHIQAMADHLRRCLTGEIKRLVINLPPRNLKSICASVALPAWILGHDPTKRIICLSYSFELAAKNSRECRAVMESDWYRRVFPRTRLSREKNTETNFQTTRGGFRFATSVGGTLTGVGGNIIVVDDPLSSGDAYSKAKRTGTNEWFDSVVYSRLDDKREGVIIIVSQRLHLEDLTGHVLQSGSWSRLILPAIAEVEERIQIGPGRFHIRRPGDLLHEEREPRAVLEQMKAESRSHKFAAQYQQCPTPEDGEIIKWQWFELYDEVPERQSGDRIVQSWDTALKSGNHNDYSVCLTFLVRGNDYYLLDVFRERLKYPDLKRHIIRLADAYRAHSYIIEDKGSGTSVIADIRDSVHANISKPIAYMPVADKVTRMMAQSAKIEARQVHLPRRAPWLGEFHDEVLQFPHGRNDDQVDALAQFLDWIDQRKRNRTIVMPLLI